MCDIENCRIRNLDRSDLELILLWRNRPEIRQFMLTQHEISAEEHLSWFEKSSRDQSKKLLIIEEQGNLLGFVQFSGVAVGGVAYWGFYLAPDAKPGSGTKLGVLSLRYAFEELKLHKICGQALASNEKSIQFHLKLGFTQEGILRQHCHMADSYLDLVEFGLLDSEWLDKERKK